MDKIYQCTKVIPKVTACVIAESCSGASQPCKMTKRLRPPNSAGRQTLGNDAKRIKRTCVSGFTLIELLVVVLIIGILAAVALPQYEAAVKKSKLTQALLWASTVREAEQVYRLANGNYTSDVSELDVQLPGCLPMEDAAGWVCANGLTVSFFVNNGVVRSVYVHVAAGEAAIEHYFDSGLRHCVTPPGDESWKRVCRSMGGKPGSRYSDYFILP